ncbi:MAG: hypothetical protein ABIP65_11680 [Vicinamibacterales bacterium]
MTQLLTRCLLALTLVAGCAGAAFAQEAIANGVRVEPKPLAATDPLAARAAALVAQLLAGNKDAATVLLRKEADDTYAKSDRLVTDVDAQIKRLSTAKYTISEFQTGLGADVMLMLAGDKGQEENIVIRFNDAKRMTGFASAKIQRN